MNPIFTTKTIHSVDVSDLSELIKSLYGRDPEIEASLELGHDEDYEIEALAEEFDEDDFNKWLQSPGYSANEIYMLMNKLSKDGHIVDGDYLLKTF